MSGRMSGREPGGWDRAGFSGSGGAGDSGLSGSPAAALLRRLRDRSPRVHCIENLAVAPDVANILLAAGAKPILAQAKEEAGEIAAACDAVVLNFGTPDEEKFEAIRRAGTAAAAAGVPLVADPVGAGASPWRRENTLAILRDVPFSAIHCNFSEALTLLGETAEFHGVDSAKAPFSARKETAERLAARRGCAVLISGEEDIVAHGSRTAVIRGGTSAMGRVTGTGCMLSALSGAFCAVEKDPFLALSAAASFWKACGEAAWEETRRTGGGPGTFHVRLFDAAWLTEEWRENIEFIKG